jgi:hypothetical protein
MRRFAQLFLISCLLAIPAIAQRGGGGFHGGGGGFHGGGGGFHGGMGGFHGGMGGFHGGGFGGPGFGGGFRGFRGGYFPGNRFGFGFGFPGYWPYYGSGWGYPYYSYPYYYPYTAYLYAGAYSYPYYGYNYVYAGPDPAYCPQANGKPLYLIKLTYNNQVWISQDYWYTADTLNFTTLQGQQNKTPISSIDRDATFRLNAECGLNFQWPR